MAAADCGVEHGGLGFAADPDARRCLFDAFLAGESAIFVAHASTIEGDPISRTYRTHGNAPVEILHDARRDRFGSGEIEIVVCERLVAVDEWNAVTGDGVPEDRIFIEDGCEQVGTR